MVYQIATRIFRASDDSYYLLMIPVGEAFVSPSLLVQIREIAGVMCAYENNGGVCIEIAGPRYLELNAPWVMAHVMHRVHNAEIVQMPGNPWLDVEIAPFASQTATLMRNIGLPPNNTYTGRHRSSHTRIDEKVFDSLDYPGARTAAAEQTVHEPEKRPIARSEWGYAHPIAYCC